MHYKILFFICGWAGFLLSSDSSDHTKSQQGKNRCLLVEVSMFGELVSSGSTSPDRTHSDLGRVENSAAAASSQVVSATTMPCRIPVVASMNNVALAASALGDVNKEEIIKFLEGQKELYKGIKLSLDNVHEMLLEIVKEGRKALIESEK